jgi:formyltetrahydrofolate-dependent phosphoribosylglycinamide formyltransferase
VRAAPIVVLASGDGSLAEALIRAGQEGAPYSVAALITDRGEINAIKRATRLGVQAEVVDFKGFENRVDWENALASKVASFGPWLVVSAGFMRILSPKFVAQFKIINSHPSLLPLFPGAHAVAEALAAGVSQAGCTVHLVDAGVDTGPVLAQRQVSIGAEDNVTALHERIKEVERILLPEVVTELALAKIRESGPRE